LIIPLNYFSFNLPLGSNRLNLPTKRETDMKHLVKFADGKSKPLILRVYFGFQHPPHSICLVGTIKILTKIKLANCTRAERGAAENSFVWVFYDLNKSYCKLWSVNQRARQLTHCSEVTMHQMYKGEHRVQRYAVRMLPPPPLPTPQEGCAIVKR